MELFHLMYYLQICCTRNMRVRSNLLDVILVSMNECCIVQKRKQNAAHNVAHSNINSLFLFFIHQLAVPQNWQSLSSSLKGQASRERLGSCSLFRLSTLLLLARLGSVVKSTDYSHPLLLLSTEHIVILSIPFEILLVFFYSPVIIRLYVGLSLYDSNS